MKEKWCIRLGATEWARYTNARMNSESMKLLGSVRKGAQMGALAQTAEGYVQVNGEFITKLNTSQIRCALAKVEAAEAHQARRMLRRVVHNAAPPPVVVVKRRRSFVMPESKAA